MFGDIIVCDFEVDCRRIFEGKAKELHNLILDVQEVMFGWSRGSALFRGVDLHRFIVEWEVMVT